MHLRLDGAAGTEAAEEVVVSDLVQEIKVQWIQGGVRYFRPGQQPTTTSWGFGSVDGADIFGLKLPDRMVVRLTNMIERAAFRAFARLDQPAG
jgi:hypothetical protein